MGYTYPPTNPFEEHKLSTVTSDEPYTVRATLDRSQRTPSPTPSEAAELKTGVFNWKSMRNWRFWIRREWLWYYVATVLVGVLAALLYLYHKQLVEFLTPPAEFLHEHVPSVTESRTLSHLSSRLNGGWAIPIALLFVLSFPPLFGHELVAVICGLVWGLWIGFAIVVAGTMLGEIGNFYAFKYCCRARGEKLERTELSYACLAKVVREGGITVALIVRLSAIPGHFTTAVFSTCGMGIVVFTIAALLSMPKQFITVYLGVVLEGSAEKATTTDKVINSVVIGITGIVTVAAMWWIFDRMNKTKPTIIYERRKARQAKLARAGLLTDHRDRDASSSTLVFNPAANDAACRSWDKNGNAVGYAPDPSFHAPQPRRPSDTTRIPLHESDDQSEYGGGGYQRSRQHHAGDAENYGRRNNESQESIDVVLAPPGVTATTTTTGGTAHSPPGVTGNPPPSTGHVQEETWASYHTARSGSPEEYRPPGYRSQPF